MNWLRQFALGKILIGMVKVIPLIIVSFVFFLIGFGKGAFKAGREFSRAKREQKYYKATLDKTRNAERARDEVRKNSTPSNDAEFLREKGRLRD